MKYLRNVLICTLSLALMIAFTGCSKEKDQKTMSSNIPTAANGDTDAMIKKILTENDKKSDTKDKYKKKVSIPISKNAKLSSYNFKQNSETTKKDNSSNASSNSNSSGYSGQIIEQPTSNVIDNPNNTVPNTTTPNIDDNFDDYLNDSDYIVRSPAYNQLSDLLKNKGELIKDTDSSEFVLCYSDEKSKMDCLIIHSVEDNENNICMCLYGNNEEEIELSFYFTLPKNSECTDILFGCVMPYKNDTDVVGACILDAKTLAKDTKVKFEYKPDCDVLNQEEKTYINSVGKEICNNIINVLQQCLAEHETGLTLKDFGFNSYK